MRSFSKRVLSLIKGIPKGKVSTYSEIARALGSKKSSRAVGNALHSNENLIGVPCHRVVRKDGSLGGYALGKRRKEELLGKEGIKIINGKIDLKKYFYGFSKGVSSR